MTERVVRAAATRSIHTSNDKDGSNRDLTNSFIFLELLIKFSSLSSKLSSLVDLLYYHLL